MLSIFEPHTDIIIKGNRGVEYGHKLCLTSRASGLVTDRVVEDDNPADSELARRMVERQAEIYGRLRDFRTGIEAGISFLKRCFGLRRCTWRGLASFKAYAWASVLSANLLTLARHDLAA